MAYVLGLHGKTETCSNKNFIKACLQWFKDSSGRTRTSNILKVRDDFDFCLAPGNGKSKDEQSDSYPYGPYGG